MDAARIDEAFRVDALASFSHEVRTPVTAVRMVLDLATRTDEGGKTLDAELVGLLETSLAELSQLLEDLQDFSRAERGRVAFDAAPARLADVVLEANRAAGERLRITLDAPPGLSGTWDAERLSSALAHLAAGVDRMGDVGGVVRGTAVAGPGSVTLVLESGAPGGPELPPGPPVAAFSYFAAGAVIAAMGGSFATERGQSYCRLSLRLPRGT